MTNHALFPRARRDRRPAPALSLGVPAAWMLSGCMSLSGLGGTSSYACKAPEGVTCDSVSGTYANAVQNNLPSQRRPAGTGTGTGTATANANANANATDHSMAAAPHSAEGVAGTAAAGAAGAVGGKAARGAVSPPVSASPPAMPLRSSARILRLWFKPWEDADRDLHDQGHVYIRVDDGRWLVEHAQQQIRDAHAPLRSPPRAAGGPPEPRDGSSATQPIRPPGPLPLPGLAAPSGRPHTPVDPASND